MSKRKEIDNKINNDDQLKRTQRTRRTPVDSELILEQQRLFEKKKEVNGVENSKRQTIPSNNKNNSNSNNNNNNNNNNNDDVKNQSSVVLPTNWREINIKELETLKKVEIDKIGELLGINGLPFKRDDLINRIAAVIETRKNIEIQDEIERSNNPFNKNFQLAIKDISNDELLFWKVFKNKFIFKNIMSSFQPNNYLSLSYDKIISVDQLINGNRINILIDKVKSKQYLSFGKDFDHLILEIFKRVTDYQFFVSLFNHYHDYIPNFNDQLILSKTLIKQYCLTGLMVLVEHFNFKPTTKTFYKAIKSYSVETLKYLKQFISNSDIIIDNETIWCIFTKKLKNIHIQMPDTGYILNKILVSKINTINHLIESGLLEINIGKEQSKSNLSSILNLCPITCSSKLKDLIEFHKFIKLFDANVGSGNDGNSDQQIIDYSIYSDDQLQSNIFDPININNNSIQKQTIKSLLDHYYKYCENIVIIDYEYYLCFNCLENASEQSIKFATENNLGKLILEYGNFKLIHKFTIDNYNNLEKWYTPKSMYNDKLAKVCTIDTRPIILFSKISDKASQFQCLQQIIQDIKDESIIKKIRKMFLFFILIQTDDLEMVKYFVNGIGHSNLQNIQDISITPWENNFILNINRYIVSIEMFDYLYENGFKSLIYQTNSTWIYYSKVSLLKHWVQLSNYDGNQLQRPFSFSINYMVVGILSIKFEVLKYVFDNPNIFNTTPNLFLIRCIDYMDYQNEYLELLKSITKNSNVNIDWLISNHYHYTIYNKETRISKLKFINWVYSTYSFNNQTRFKLDEPDKIIYSILLGTLKHEKIDFFDGYSFSNPKFQFVFDIINRCDVETFEIIIQQVYNKFANKCKMDVQTNIKSFLLQFLKSIISMGQIKFLEYIQLHHPNILKRSSTKNNGMFIQTELVGLIAHSLQSNNLKVTEFLLQLITITKNQFEKSLQAIPNSISSNYFKNKFTCERFL